MEEIKSSINRSKKSVGGGETRGNMNPEEWEIRPGGMLVQKRDPNSDESPVSSVLPIRIRVKHGSNYHEIRINSQASFGELKKMVEEKTGIHHEDQKMIYKKKERNSKEFLDAVKVKDGSKMVVVEDIASRERRCLEMFKLKAAKTLSQIRSRVERFSGEVAAMESTVSRGGKVSAMEVEKMIGSLMTELVKLDGMNVTGELNLQKLNLEKKLQKYVETLDKMKEQGKMPEKSNAGKNLPLKQQGVSVRQQKPKPMQQQSESVIYSTKWETFE